MNRTVSGQPTFPLYQNAYEHDSCGVGLVVDIAGNRSRRIVELALGGLVNLTHRGGVGADERTGDGAGILTQLPHELFASVIGGFGSNARPGEYGVATIFLPNDAEETSTVKSLTAAEADALGIAVLGWRIVPVDTDVLGRIASDTRPAIEQLFLGRPAGQDEAAFERTLMLFRKGAERAAANAGIQEFYVASCSCRTIIYK